MAFDFGVQSYTYRSFDIEELPAILDSTPISAVEVYPGHLGPDDDSEYIRHVLDSFDKSGLQFCGVGVFDFESEDEVGPALKFASTIGASYVSAHFQPNDHEVIERLIEASAELDVRIAIHNHGPGAIYSTVDEVISVLEDYPQAPNLGACVDTGHFFRSGESPEETIPALGERIHAVHVKDFLDEETEVVPGEGNLDVGEMLNLLNEHADLSDPLVIEYEEDESNPTPAIQTTCDRLLAGI